MIQERTHIIAGPCTCHMFWQLLRDFRAALDKPAAWEKFDNHWRTCPACQQWHSQPLPELPEDD